MEESMSYILQPTLQHMAMAKIAIAWWIRDEVLPLIPINNTKVHVLFQDEMEVIVKMRENVRNLHLPKELKDEILTFIKPIGTQIVQWYQYLRHEFRLERRNPQELRWTSAGTIDIKESVLVLVQDQSLDILQRYELACCYCFTQEMHELSQEIGQEGLLGLVNNSRLKLVVFWNYYLRNETNQLRRIIDAEDPGLSPAEYAFKCAALSVNPVAMEYFFVQLSSQEKLMALGLYPEEVLEQVFYLCAKDDHDNTPLRFYSQTLCFFLSRMNDNQRGKLFRNCVEATLDCFLNWPYHCFFLTSAQRMRSFISEYDFAVLLTKIETNLQFNTCEGRNVYREMFYGFWRGSPSLRHKKFLIVAEKDSFRDLMGTLLVLGEKGLCRLMLRDAEAEEKEKLIDAADFNFMQWMRYGELDLLKFLLEECAFSVHFVDGFKEAMFRRKSSFKEHRRNKIFRILDNYLSGKKRLMFNLKICFFSINFLLSCKKLVLKNLLELFKKM